VAARAAVSNIADLFDLIIFLSFSTCHPQITALPRSIAEINTRKSTLAEAFTILDNSYEIFFSIHSEVDSIDTINHTLIIGHLQKLLK
jgi:hypothetical protein